MSGDEEKWFAERLLTWYDRHGRHDLPWQRPRTPYRVWVSEVMLQQTRVSTVIPYFVRFMDRFPDVESLARAPVDDVLTLWSGLGYYRRARYLHDAARRIVSDHGARLPKEFHALADLPGIGRSTAGAILALGHGRRFPILDGNVKRVLTRYHGIEGWPGRSPVERGLWEISEKHIPGRRVTEYTQAIMDLGATVCTRVAPSCHGCPLSQECRACGMGNPEAYPTPRPPRRLPSRQTVFLCLVDSDGNVLLHRRPPTGVWGGLWSLPECPADERPARWSEIRLGFTVTAERRLPPLRHGFSHFTLEMLPVVLQAGRRNPARVNDDPSVRWFGPEAFDGLGLPAPIRRLLRDIHRV